MNSEFLKSEMDKSIEAKLESDAAVRDLNRLVSAATVPGSGTSASDRSKDVHTAIALNAALKEQTEALRKAHYQAVYDEVAATVPEPTGPKSALRRVKRINAIRAIVAAKLRGGK